MDQQNSKKFRQNFVFEFPEDLYNKFISNKNRTEFLTQLVKNYYDENIINVRLDQHTREMLKNDFYGEFRIQMLLMEFYSKGNINSLLNTTSTVKTEMANNMEHENNLVLKTRESTNNKEVHGDEDNFESNIIETPVIDKPEVIVDNNYESENNESNHDIDEENTQLNNYEEEYSNNNEVAITHTEDDNKHDSDNENKLKHNKSNRTGHKIPKDAIGNINDMFVNKVPKNNKNLI